MFEEIIGGGTGTSVSEDSAKGLYKVMGGAENGASWSFTDSTRIQTVTDSANQRVQELGHYSYVIGTIVIILYMLFAITKLSLTADDPVGRKAATHEILSVGIALALMGGIATVVQLFFRFFDLVA